MDISYTDNLAKEAMCATVFFLFWDGRDFIGWDNVFLKTSVTPPRVTASYAYMGHIVLDGVNIIWYICVSFYIDQLVQW